MIDAVLNFFGLCRLSELKKVQRKHFECLQELYFTKNELKQARKNNYRDARGRFTKAPQ